MNSFYEKSLLFQWVVAGLMVAWPPLDVFGGAGEIDVSQSEWHQNSLHLGRGFSRK